MGKKRSLRPRLSQSAVEIPRKKTKLKGKSVTKPKEVVRNDGETSAPLTAAEKVGKNMDLMNLIVRNIDKVSERKNIAESCKAFNVLCNSKESYVESFKYGNGERYIIQYSIIKPVFIAFDDVLVIGISHYSRSVTKRLEMAINEIKMNRHKIKSLKIKNLPSGYLNFFKELDCFENVKRVHLELAESKYIPLGIFSEWKSLKPDTLIFGSVVTSIFDRNDICRTIYNNEKYTFPKCLKHIHLIGETRNIDWMVDAFENFGHYELESLVLGENFTKYLTAEGMKSVTTVARYFKEIQFSICQSYPSFIFLNEYFSQMWEEFGTSEFFLLSFDIRFNVPKCDVDVWASRSPPTKERSLVCNLYENVSMCERFKCIKNFKIEMYDNFYEVDDFDAEMLSIKEKLLKMENLTTFEIDLSVIMEPYNFPIYYGGLNRNLKNMRLCNCYSLELYSLIEIGHRCTKIENISLTEVRSNEITIKSIMSLFKNLKGLDIQFTSNYCFDNIINDLAKKDEVKGNYLLDWPDIDFLKICFNEPDNKGVKLLNAVEKNTPRRSGRFLIKQKTSDENKTLWEIIIQRNTNYITEFNDIFKTHYVF